jgi:drug/metabolite transporter (DMT)-like permease
MHNSGRASGATKERDLGAAALAALALVWGYGWIVTKIGFDYVEPYTFMAIRGVLSVACLFALLIVLRRPLRPVAIGLTAIVGLLQTGAFTACSTWALSHTAAGKTAVLTYTMPFWLLVLAWVFLGEHVRGVQWPAVALAFAGLVLVVEPWHIAGAAAGAMAVAAGLVWASSAVVVKILRRRHTVDVLSLTAWQMLFGTLPLILIAVFTYERPPTWSTPLIAVMAYNVLLANGAAWVLWLYALRALSAGGAGLGTLAVPVVGVIAAWIHLGERPAPLEALGMTLVIAALALLSAHELAAGRRLRSDARRGPSAGAAPAPVSSPSGTLDACSGQSRSTSGTHSSSTSAAESAKNAVPTSSQQRSSAPRYHAADR